MFCDSELDPETKPGSATLAEIKARQYFTGDVNAVSDHSSLCAFSECAYLQPVCYQGALHRSRW